MDLLKPGDCLYLIFYCKSNNTCALDSIEVKKKVLFHKIIQSVYHIIHH